MAISKLHEDYWARRIIKRKYRSNGKWVESPDWQVRLQPKGRDIWFNLATPNKAIAARKAKEIYAHLLANGFDDTVAKYKSQRQPKDSSPITVGNYLDAIRALERLNPKTLQGYVNSFRTIIAGIFGIKGGRSKFDYRGGGNQKWIDRIDSVRLERITPDLVSHWQRQFVRKAGKSPAAQASARRSSNSYIRCARSLFSPKLMKTLPFSDLPKPLPFDGVELLETGSTRYFSRIDAESLIAAANAELKEAEPEAYKVFLLALFGGMRKAEIDSVEWSAVDWKRNLIILRPTKYLQLKTADSEGLIALDPEVMTELSELKEASKGPFIIASKRRPKVGSSRQYYRCEGVFDRLSTWLRSKGVTANKPIHELRKEIGSLVATEHGIFAASQFLRHSDITTTARHYADHQKTISVGLGKLLKTDL